MTIDASTAGVLELKPEQFEVEVLIESPSKDFQIFLSINDGPDERTEVMAKSKSHSAQVYNVRFFARLVASPEVSEKFLRS